MIDLCQWRAAIGGYNSRYRWNPGSNGRAKVLSPWIPFLYATLTVLSQLTSLTAYLVENVIFSSLATSVDSRMEEKQTFPKLVATKVWSLFGWCCQVSSSHSSVLATGLFLLHLLSLNSSPAEVGGDLEEEQLFPVCVATKAWLLLIVFPRCHRSFCFLASMVITGFLLVHLLLMLAGDIETNPGPDPEANKKLTALMNKYKDQPTINYKSLKCSFIGPPRTGKTTTRMRLMEEIVNIATSGLTTSESTQLQKPITVQMYEKSEIAPAVLGISQWKKNDWLGEMQLLLHRIQRQAEDPKPERPTRPTQEGTKPAKKPTSPPVPDENASTAKQQPKKIGSAPKDVGEQQDDHPKSLTFDYVEEMMKEVLEKRGLKDIEDMEDTVTTYIMDFGGQPEFQDVLSVVLRGPALHLVFFNASLSLNNPVHVKYCPAKGSADTCIEYDTKYIMCQMLFQILSSLYCLSKTLLSGEALPHFTPTAVLIGTHTDQTMSVDEVSDTLQGVFQDTKFWNNDFLCTPTSCRSVFYPLDNQYGTKEEIQGLQKFIRELILQRLRSTPIPKSWLLFHIALRHRYEGAGWCSMEQCVRLAAQCNIPREDVQPILQYIHYHIGNVLHYANVPGLWDIVFCEPNKLLEAINRVILSFVGDSHPPYLAQEMRKTGEVHGKLLSEIEAKVTESSFITNRVVICLLKHFKIIFEVPGMDKIFVPCMLLPDISIELASHNQLKDVHPQPLLIQFEGGYIPLSVFSGLAVELMSRHKWMLKTEARFRNHLMFDSPTCSVELIGHLHFLEIRLIKEMGDQDSPSVQECCKSVLKIFEESTASVVNSYEHTKGTSFALGFYCPCSLSRDSQPHFCKLISNTFMTCSRTGRIHQLGNRDTWFREPNDDGASTEGDEALTGKPASPKGLSIAELALSDSVKITWSSYTSPEPRYSPADKLVVERSDDKGDTYKEVMVVDVAKTEALVSGLIPNTTYKLRLVAVNQAGKSDPSIEIDFQTPVGGN